MTVGLSLSERNRLRATHNHSRSNDGRPTKTFTAWVNMIQRCYNESHKSFHRYGGRGIKVCERWKDSFENFLEDMGESPDGLQLDRKDVDGDYEPDNCRWVTPKVNANNRGNNTLIEHDGRTQTVSEWAREIGISKQALLYRLNNGWSVSEALSMKLGHGNGWARGSR